MVSGECILLGYDREGESDSITIDELLFNEKLIEDELDVRVSTVILSTSFIQIYYSMLLSRWWSIDKSLWIVSPHSPLSTSKISHHDLVVSWIGATPKSSHFLDFSLWTIYFGEPPICGNPPFTHECPTVDLLAFPEAPAAEPPEAPAAGAWPATLRPGLHSFRRSPPRSPRLRRPWRKAGTTNGG